MAVSSAALTAADQPLVRRSLADPGYRARLRYLVFGRAVPATLFAFVGALQLRHLVDRAAPATLAAWATDLLPAVLYALFCCIPVAIYLARPMPKARDGRLAARAAAFTGTTMMLVVGAFLPTGTALFVAPEWVRALAALATVAAWFFALYSLAYLRRSLSIIPEARRLATGGPYRVVRHPLYLAEITAATAIIVAAPHLVPLLALAVFVLMQCWRSGYEEGLLARAFPEYAAYAARTRRLIPFVW